MVGGGHQTILVKPFQKARCYSEAKKLSHVREHGSDDDSGSVTKSGLKAGEQFPPSSSVLNYLRKPKQNNCSDHILRQNLCFHKV